MTTCSSKDCEEEATEVLQMDYVGITWRAPVCTKHKRETMKTMEGR